MTKPVSIDILQIYRGTYVKLDNILTFLRERKISFLEKMNTACKDGNFTLSSILGTQVEVFTNLINDFESLKY